MGRAASVEACISSVSMRVYTSVSPLQKHLVLFGGSLAWGHLNIADQRVCFCLAASQVFFFFPPLRLHAHKVIDMHKILHTQAPFHPFFLGGGGG